MFIDFFKIFPKVSLGSILFWKDGRIAYNERGLLLGWNSLLVLPGTAAE